MDFKRCAVNAVDYKNISTKETKTVNYTINETIH